ncbi:MAG: hypothetical protein CR982_10195 [Candidatus Cloacimonadota bacterium]|nr:MAG: hypothetical protein CR982_10195 [Candidatus Cloacimonadota bacterium]PIE78785.1 MAG: hypothetical protein CSA15_05930 [Candidatus Delongbacteria bacterium]
MRYILPLLIFSAFLFSEKLRIGEINISGNERTKDYLIRDYFGLKVGDIFDTKKVLEYEDRVNKTKLFRSVSIDYDKIERYVIISISVIENWYLFPLPYLNFHNNGFSDISFGVIGVYRNFIGIDHDLLLINSWGYREYTSFEYNCNYLRNSNWKGFFTFNVGDQIMKKSDLDDEDKNFPDYYNLTMIEIKPIYQSIDYGDFGGLISWEKRGFNKLYGVRKSNFFKLGVFHRYNSYDIQNYPTKGFFVSTSLDFNGLDIYNKTKFMEFDFEFRKVFSLFKFTYNKPMVAAITLRHNHVAGSKINRENNIFLNYDQLIRGFNPIFDNESFSLISTALRFRALETDPIRAFSFLPGDHKLNNTRLLVSMEIFIDNSFLDKSIKDYSFDNIITTVGSSLYIENPFIAGSLRFDFGYYLGSSSKFINKEKFRVSFEVIKHM